MPLASFLSAGRFMWQIVSLCLLAGACPSNTGEPVADKAAGERWAVILVGLPGDDEHETIFRETADAWQKWLTETLDFPSEHVLRLPAAPAAKDRAPDKMTALAIRTQIAGLSKTLQPDDTLWVFTLGHGNHDGKQAWFHVAGRDPSNADFGRWLDEIKCREQVLWLTHSCSGWFLKPLSKPGRIVIAATAADDEVNETEFPYALASVVARPADQLDEDQDGTVSIAELFTAVVAEVTSRFTSDKRVPTEHAQVDDNGDGRGSESLVQKKEATDAEVNPAAEQPTTPAPAPAPVDGDLARKTAIPLREPLKRSIDCAPVREPVPPGPGVQRAKNLPPSK